MRSPKLRTPEQGNVQGTKPGRTTPWRKQAATPSPPPRAGAPIKGSGKGMPEPGVWGADVSVSLSAAQEGSGCSERLLPLQAMSRGGSVPAERCGPSLLHTDLPATLRLPLSCLSTEALASHLASPRPRPLTLCLVPQMLTEASCGRSLCCAPGLGSPAHRECAQSPRW